MRSLSGGAETLDGLPKTTWSCCQNPKWVRTIENQAIAKQFEKAKQDKMKMMGTAWKGEASRLSVVG